MGNKPGKNGEAAADEAPQDTQTQIDVSPPDGDAPAASDDNQGSQDNVSALPVLDVPAKFKRRSRRVSVSAECGVMEEKYVKKVVPKSEDAIARIKQAVSKSFLFSSLNNQQLTEIVDSMEERKVTADEVIIKQGDTGDFFYVIDSGKYDVLKKVGDEPEKKVFFYDEKGSFGELALMYNTPRAATVKATSDGVLWVVERSVFRHIIVTATARQRALYEKFLEKVELFEKLTSGERSLIADCLEPLTFAKGDKIITQGDEGDKFYLVEEGECIATQEHEGKEVEVGRIPSGKFFGERALIKNEPRAANVVADSDKVVVAGMERAAFERLLGPCKGILERHLTRYKTASELVAEASIAEEEVASTDINDTKPISWVIEYTVAEGSEEKHLELIKGMAEGTLSETTTTVYAFLQPDKEANPRKWQLAESYNSQGGALSHVKNVGPKLGPWRAVMENGGWDRFLVCHSEDLHAETAAHFEPLPIKCCQAKYGFHRDYQASEETKNGVVCLRIYYNVAEGKDEEHTAAVRALVAQTEEKEPGTLEYAFWQPNEDNPREWMVSEMYATQDDALTHLGNSGDLLSKYMETIENGEINAIFWHAEDLNEDLAKALDVPGVRICSSGTDENPGFMRSA